MCACTHLHLPDCTLLCAHTPYTRPSVHGWKHPHVCTSTHAHTHTHACCTILFQMFLRPMISPTRERHNSGTDAHADLWGMIDECRVRLPVTPAGPLCVCLPVTPAGPLCVCLPVTPAGPLCVCPCRHSYDACSMHRNSYTVAVISEISPTIVAAVVVC
jgi:hypothetical protein